MRANTYKAVRWLKGDKGPPSFNLCSIANSMFVLEKLILISLAKFLSLKGEGYYVVRPAYLTLYEISS